MQLPYDGAPDGVYTFGLNQTGLPQTVIVLRKKFQSYDSRDIFNFMETLKPIVNERRPSTFYLRNQATFSNVNYNFGQKTWQFPLEGAPYFIINLLESVDSILNDMNLSNGLNGCHISYYPDGKAGLEPHVDDEPVIDQSVPIASVSFGCARKFRFYRKQTEEERRVQLEKSKAKTPPLPKPVKLASIDLNNGDLLIMVNMQSGEILHGVEKCASIKERRVNLTFRKFKSG